MVAELDSWEGVDCSDEHYQVMLKASFGMNFTEFIDILDYIFERRLNGLGGSICPDAHTGDDYLMFDLDRIHALVENMLGDDEDNQFSAEDLQRLDKIKETTYK